ncbi:MAG: class I SAM-dependent methyltransferase [Armatimonadetes bacterium]|nr:class I SAM-dependent methyltransferase [Armatimonadota bacterium]
MYDELSAIYDRFIDWPARLARELPPLLAWLGEARAVADVACGTGGHSLALAQHGYTVTGFDISGSALDSARARAAETGSRAEFVKAGYGELAASGRGPFDAVISLGNSLPHVTDQPSLHAAFSDFGKALRPGGRLLLGMRNLPRAIAHGERWLPPKGCLDPDGTEWLFDRFYDWRSHGLVDFNFVVYRRAEAAQPWQREVHTTRLRAWPLSVLTDLLDGWHDVALLANLAGQPFDPAGSGDLIISARRP